MSVVALRTSQLQSGGRKLVSVPEGCVLHIIPQEDYSQGHSVWNTSTVNTDESCLPICSNNLKQLEEIGDSRSFVSC